MGFTSFATAWTQGDESAVEDEIHLAGQLEGTHILAPILEADEQTISDQVTVATMLARSIDASLLVTHPLTFREQPLERHRREIEAGDEDELIGWALDATDTDVGTAQGSVRCGRALVKRVLRAITSHDIDTVVLPGGSSRGILRRDAAEQIATQAECDVVIVNGQPGFEDVASILLPIAGGPHSGLATDIAKGVAENHDAWIDLLHIVERDPPEYKRQAAEQYLAAARERLGGFATCDTWILEANDVAEAIIEQSDYYPLTVLEAPTKGRLRQFVFGSTTQDIRADAQSVVLLGRNNRDAEESLTD